MKSLLTCAVVLVVSLSFYGANPAQHGSSGERDTRQDVLPLPSVDGELDRDVERKTTGVKSIWPQLEELSLGERENSNITLELLNDTEEEAQREIERIECLWEERQFDQAIEELRTFEESNVPSTIGVGISWIQPKRLHVSEVKALSADVRVGARENVEDVVLDADASSGNLFVALRYSDELTDYWTVNISTDDGLTWSETYRWSDGTVINDISAVVLNGFFYVASTCNDSGQARVRRFYCTSGSVDGAYGQHQVFWPRRGTEILEVALASTEYHPSVDVLEFMAILADNSLVHYESNNEGWNWSKWGTRFTNARYGLDVHINQPITSATELVASYISTDNRLHAVVFADGVWFDNDLEDSELSVVSSAVTSVAAYEDRVMVVHKFSAGGFEWHIRYWVSYDGGDTWTENGDIAVDPDGRIYAPHVAGRNGGGFRVVYAEEGGEPDVLWARHRDYGTAPDTVAWDDPALINDTDVLQGIPPHGTPINVEWIPPIVEAFAHGIVWIGGEDRGAYFDRIEGPGVPDIEVQPTTLDIYELGNRVSATSSIDDPYAIDLKSRRFTPDSDESLSLGELKVGRDSRSHVIIQSFEPLTAAQFNTLGTTDIRILHYVSSRAFAASVTADFKQDAYPFIRWIGQLDREDKISGYARRELKKARAFLIVEAFPDVSAEQLEDVITEVGAQYLTRDYLPDHMALVKANPTIVERLADQDEIAWIIGASSDIVENQPISLYPSGMTRLRSAADYVTLGPGWDGPGFGSVSLTYFFTNGTPDIPGDEEQIEIVRALQKWADPVQITWNETSLAQQDRSMDILFATGDHGDHIVFDGPGGILAHCFHPAPDPEDEPMAGDLHFDEDETWQIGADPDIFSVALHEAGHALGLGHSDNPEAVMYFAYKRVTDLHPDDIAGIKALYASRGDVFAISNSGGVDLEVLSISSDKDWLTLTPSTPPTLVIPPRGYAVIECTVDWSGVTAPYEQAIITIDSNDPDENQVIVTVFAYKNLSPP